MTSPRFAAWHEVIYPKEPILMPSPQAFVNKWKLCTLTERASAQSHFNELCALLGQPTPTDADPTGASYTFEKGAAKQGGQRGWADVWKRGYFAWEYKGKKKSLTKAYEQLLLYRESLENPPLLVVSDIATIEVHTNFTNTVKKVYRFTLDDLLKPELLAQLGLLFTNPQALREERSPDHLTLQAAQEFARLASLLSEKDTQQRADFLVRLLFCLFAEDIGLLPKQIFSQLLNKTRPHSEAFSQQLGYLFAAMRDGGFFGFSKIRNFKGWLFDNEEVLPLPPEGLEILARVATLDWSSIEPAILGTLFERLLDPNTRSQLGAHYTSKEDILLIVEPVLMAPLRREWEELKREARTLEAKRDKMKGRKRQASPLEQQMLDLLTTFAQRLKQVRILDPACGSGNFLYVALKQLLDLEKEVITFAGELGLQLFFPTVAPEQLYGIEVNEYAHQLAQATIWIGYIQWLRDNGFGTPSEAILKPLNTIRHQDAILAYDKDGTPIEPEWPEADVIIGNPPFLGDRKMRRELGDRYVEHVRELYKGRLPSSSDLVCYWFERTRTLIHNKELKRAGLLATQAIRGGSNRVVLERIKKTGDIFWAESDREWFLEGANVHVSMIGFDDGGESQKMLDGDWVKVIHADLTSGTNLTQAEKLAENAKLSFIGTQKSGPFDLTNEEACEMLSWHGNPNNRPNSDVIKPWINATDITRRPRHKWIIDFGHKIPLEEAVLYEKPFEYVRQHVKPKRDTVRRKQHREKWWLFGNARPGMRNAISKLSRYMVTPMVSKHRIFAWVDINVISENLLVVFAREDDYFLGVLHSKLHELWSRCQGTQLREATSGQRYTPTSTFETFPFPWAPGKEATTHPDVQAIAEAARALNEKRERWLNPTGLAKKELNKRTLTNLYNKRPTWLDLAHRKLDVAVLNAYGWDHDLNDEEILERLLALNLARTGK
jgi:type II restriction/modification system DNA methylase subunit YeeA